MYVGISADVDKRWSQHRSYLMKGYKNRDDDSYEKNKYGNKRHHQISLQNEFNLYYSEYKDRIWMDVYKFELELEISNDIYKNYNILHIEDEIIKQLNDSGTGYNQLTSLDLYIKYGFVYDSCGERISSILINNKEEIVKWYESGGISYKDIAKKYNTNTSAIMRFFKYIGYNTRDHSHAKLGFNLDDYKSYIVKSYCDMGITATEIAKEFGVCCSAITSKLKKWNIKQRSVQERSGKPNLNDHKEDIIEMYFKKGISFKSIGSYYGVSKTTVMRYFKKWNINERN